jgi:AraC family transcriptional regulator
MNSSKAFDDVAAYLEGIAYSGNDIDYGEIARIAASPAALFQRIFTFVAEVSISEYVRKRRLTIAGHELANSDSSVLDVAVKYGFQSHAAFTRAFQAHHGVTPTEARLHPAKLSSYLPINFSEMRFIGGKRIMAELKKITYKETEERLMVGMGRETSFQEAGQVWREFFEGGACEIVNDIPAESRCCGDIDANDGIGLMCDFKDKDTFTIVIGDFVRTGTAIPEGLAAQHIPKGFAAHVQIEGNSIPDILSSAYLLITEAIEKTGAELDHEHFYWCEVYTKERYSEPLRRGEKVALDYILPVKAMP